MCSNQEVKHIISIILNSQGAEAAPPLGTVLGNLGINAIKFSKEFNEFTKDLPTYFRVRVIIFVYENKNIKYEIKAPTTGCILSLLKESFPDDLIPVDEIVKLAKFKLPNLSLKSSVSIILGSVYSAGLLLDWEDDN